MREVKRYVEGCNACQRNKNCTEQLAGKLMPNSIPDKAWTHISADFITKLPLVQVYNSILVVVDQYHKWSLTMFVMENLIGFKSLELKSRVRLSDKRCC